MTHIYLAYPRSDRQEAIRLQKELEALGHQTWLDKRDLAEKEDYTSAIEIALEKASHVVICITRHADLKTDALFKRELVYALAIDQQRQEIDALERLPILPVVYPEGNAIPLLAAWKPIQAGKPAEMAKTAKAISDQLDRRPGAGQTASYHDSPDISTYLNKLMIRTARELKQNVHNVLTQIYADPVVTMEGEPLPWPPAAPFSPNFTLAFSGAALLAGEKISFPSLKDASLHYENRVLLLGPPGAGKTTALLDLARQAATERLINPNAPVPVLANIRTWDHETPVLEWIDSQHAGTRLVGAPRLYLLDGLDELGGERPINLDDPQGGRFDPRVDFIHQLQKQVVKGPIILTSRSYVYDELVRKTALPAPVHLEAMTDTQIEEHLSAYGKPEGWRWLQTKKKWVDAARRPLTLSLLPLIFDATADDSQEELRGVEEIGILERGVRRRFEHEIAREGEDMLPFNRPALRSYLGGVAFRMWSSDYYPHASLPLEGVQRELGRNAKKFIAFAIRLGFLSANEAGEYEFLHTKLRDYFAVRSFVDILLYGDETRRLEAAEALGQIGDPMAIKALAKTIQEEDPALRAESARALGRIGADEGLPHLLLALQDETDLVREKARIALQSFVRETALPNLLHALRSENPLVRSFATHALADLGRISTSGLLNALHDADSRVRWRAAVTLGQIQDPRAIPDLIASLSDSFYWVRGSAAKALGQLGDPQAVPGLVATLKDEDSSVRKAAARALGEIGTPAIDGLAGALRDKNFFVRKAAAEAMEEIGTAKARAILTQWRRD